MTVFVLGAGILARARRRASQARSLSTEPVSGEWLAQARGREEHNL